MEIETDNKKNWGYYIELCPDELALIREQKPIVYLPWGAVEWHGPHLPTGVDGFIANAIAERVVQRTGGVLLPTTWWSTTAIPHPDTITTKTATLYKLLIDIFEQLAESDWKVVVIISGIYSQIHELMMIKAAIEAIQKRNILVLSTTPFAIIDETLHDHSGLWETSIMLSLHPDKVNLEALGNEPLEPCSSGVIGQDPRGAATASKGKQAINLAVEIIVKSVEQLLEKGDPNILYALYEKRRLIHQAFIKRYNQGSIEETCKAWWDEICQEKSEKS